MIKYSLQQLKTNCLIIDIETWAEFENGQEININSQFDQYLSFAKIKWFGAYSYARNMLYILEVSKNKQLIQELLKTHSIIIGFNSVEFDYPILKNNGFILDEKKYVNHIDCMQILGKSVFYDKKGFAFKNRGALMGYNFKNNSLKSMAEEMQLEFQKGDIDYHIFNKNTWTASEEIAIKTYLKNDILITKQMFDKLCEYWFPFTNLLNKKYIDDFSWIKNSIAALTYKAACSYLGLEPTYSDKTTVQEKMGGNVLLPKYEEAYNVWYVDFSSLYPHIFCMFNLFNEKEHVDGDNLWHGNNLFQVRGYYDIKQEHRLNNHIKNKLSERIHLKHTDKNNPMVNCLKIFLNAIYGVARSNIFEKLHTPNCGWDCCWLGQQLQSYVIKRMEEFGFESIYGDTDSCAKDTPITILKNNQIEIIPIEDLSPATNQKASRKDNLINRNIKILTDKGWNQIKYIYKHKCKKQMYRILTRKGYVEVSKDHSIVINNKSIKPEQLSIGDEIELYSLKLNNNIQINSNLAWLIGFWSAEGSCRDYRKTCNKLSWHLDNKKIELLEKAKKILQEFGIRTKIIDCRKSSGTYRLVSDGNCKILVDLFSEWCLSKSGIKKVPSFILNSQYAAKIAFLQGYWEGDGHKDLKDGSLSICSIDKPLLKGVTDILTNLNYEYSLKIRPDKPNVISLRIILNKMDKRLRKPNKIIKIESFELNDYIYDIETKNHHFCGGFGNINLHNSVMFISKDKIRSNKVLVQEYLRTIIKEINANVPFPVDTFDINIEGFLDYIMFPFADEPIMNEDGTHKKINNRLIKEKIGKKKNYLYIKTEGDKKTVTLVGLPIKKENATPFGFKIFNEVLEPLIIKNNNAKFPFEFIQKTINEYLQRKDILSLLVQEYRVKPFNTYKNPSQIQAQISKEYFNGQDGIIQLIKNKKIGRVGKGTKYCSLEEANQHNLTEKDLYLEKLWNELTPFINNLTHLVIKNERKKK